MKALRLAGKIISTLIKDRIHYPGRLLADTLSFSARCGLLLALYWYVFRWKGGSINGASFPPAAWSMFFYFVFMILYARNNARMISADVRSGSIELLLAKPISYFWYRCVWQIGYGVYPFLSIGVIGSLVLALSVGIPSTMAAASFIPTSILAFAGSLILTLILYGLIGVLAFWIEDINPFYWMVDKAVMILGGSYLPIALFPPLMYKIAVLSPFGASQLLSHAPTLQWAEEWPRLLAIQACWIISLGLALRFILSAARRKLSVNGG